MPVFRSGKGMAPDWCELEYFDIVDLKPGDTHTFERMGKKEKVIVGEGKCRVAVNGQEKELEKGGIVDLTDPAAPPIQVRECAEPTTLIRMAGRWGEQVGGSGLFPVMNADVENPPNWGGPVDYKKKTGFDNHYHDCDEYWIVIRGRGTAVSEGKFYEVGPGDCVATGMGHYHDFPEVAEPVLAVFFETTMQGEKRIGHLWEHQHGPAQPQPERV
jgi:mannose-6-phosphate isomerase-like protein (cupin superfamily)